MATEVIDIRGEQVEFTFKDEADLLSQVKKADASIRNEQLSGLESFTEGVTDVLGSAAVGAAKLPLGAVQLGTAAVAAVSDPVEGREVAEKFQRALNAETQNLIDTGLDFSSAVDLARSNVAERGIVDPAATNIEDFRRAQTSAARTLEKTSELQRQRSPIAQPIGEIAAKGLQLAPAIAPLGLVGGSAAFGAAEGGITGQISDGIPNGGLLTPQQKNIPAGQELQERAIGGAVGAAEGALLGGAFKGAGVAATAAAPVIAKGIMKLAEKSAPIAAAVVEGIKSTTRGTSAGVSGTGRLLVASKNTLGDFGNALTGNTQPIIKSLQSRALAPETKMGLEIEKVIGAELTAAQLTGAPIARAAEKGLRTKAEFADRLQGQIAKNVSKGIQKLDDIAATFATRPINTIKLTSDIRKAHSKAVDDAITNRAKQAKVEFDLAKETGATGKFGLPSFQGFVDDIINRGAAEGAFKTDRKIANSIKKQFAPLFEEGTTTLKPVNIDSMQKLLEQWGRATAGRGKIVAGQDRGDAIATAKQGFGSLQRDLSAYADGVGGSAGKILQKARDNYRINSQAIGAIDDHALKVTLDTLATKNPMRGDAQFIDSIVRIAESGDEVALKSIIGFLNDKSPRLLKQLQRGIVERAITAGQVAGRKSKDSFPVVIGGKATSVSPDVIKSNLPSPSASAILFPNQPQAQKEIELVFQLLKRLTQDIGGSPTAEKISGALFTGGVKTGIVDTFVGHLITGNEAAINILLNPAARKQFLNVASKSKKKAVDILEDVNEAIQ